MATFICLSTFTDQGIRNIKESPERLNAIRAMVEKLGVSVKSIFYTLGSHDTVITLEGSEEAVTSALLKAASLGNVRTQIMRAFSPDEMAQIISKMP